MGPKNRVLDGDEIHMNATWRISSNDPYSAMIRAVATITLATCYLARSANLPEGLHILPMFFSIFFYIIIVLAQLMLPYRSRL